ncbi:MAG: MFS transporter [Candidatus Bathyarchaeia archaeon]
MNKKRDETEPHSWLNRNVIGMGLSSLFSDMSHEMATAILPFFIMFVVGGNAAIVGLVEGASDGSSSLTKSYSGYYSDKSGKRTPIMYLGYVLTGVLIPAIGFATTWIQVLLLRVGAWMGRGARGPPRDALLVDSIPSGTVGKAFGFQSALDTIGAIIGPAIALLLIPYLSLSRIFFISFIPGIVCVIVVATLVKDRSARGILTRNSGLEHKTRSFVSSVKILPRGFKLFLASVGLFGVANFSNVIFTLRAEQVMQSSLGIGRASQIAVLLYLVLNIVYALGSFPAGHFADKLSKRNLLGFGYFVFALACIASIFESSNFLILLTIFILAGLQTAVVDTVERAYASELITETTLRGTGFGVLQTVNGVGDFVSSTMIGVLWVLLSPSLGFAVVAFIAIVALALLLTLNPRR